MCSIPHSKIFLLNQCGQFVWWRKSEYPGKSPYRRSVTYILDHTEVVSSTPATPHTEVELTRTIVVIGTDFICGCKCKYPGTDPEGGGRVPPKIGKNKNFWHKIVILHTKYPKHFCASLCSAQFF
jgi:hypothetical protein